MKQGRPKKMLPKHEAFIIRYTRNKPNSSLKELKNVMAKRFRIKLSVSSLREIRKRYFKYKHKSNNIFLKQEHIEKRNKFVTRILEMLRKEKIKLSSKQRKYPTKIYFSDESRICKCNDSNQEKLWQEKGNISNEEYDNNKVKFDTSIMVFGVIGFNYKSPLVLCERRQNSTSYCRMLETNGILADMKRTKNKYYFVQDGASCHTSKYTKKFLKAHGVPFFEDWPPNSPDLNPIENMWSILKRKIQWRDEMTETELFIESQRVWNNIPMKIVNNLVSSFPKRLIICRYNHFKSISNYLRHGYLKK